MKCQYATRLFQKKEHIIIDCLGHEDTLKCTFGILSNKWRIFHRPLNVSVEFAEDIVKACTVLHNFLRVRIE
jgi:hypothetical protein